MFFRICVDKMFPKWLLIWRINILTSRTFYNTINSWGRMTHICVGKLTIIGSDNGLPPGRRQAIIWTSAGILLIGPLRTNFSEILIGIQTLSFTKIHLQMSSAKWRQFVSGSMCSWKACHRELVVADYYPSYRTSGKLHMSCWHVLQRDASSGTSQTKFLIFIVLLGSLLLLVQFQRFEFLDACYSLTLVIWDANI